MFLFHYFFKDGWTSEMRISYNIDERVRFNAIVEQAADLFNTSSQYF